MKKILALALMFLIFATPILAQAANSSSQKSRSSSSPTVSDKSAPERGKGLANAIEHVPYFVAEKLTYQAKLFSEGVRGIGKSLSEWIHSFFSPVVKKNNQSAE